MPVTKTEIKYLFNTDNVKQYGSKQLFLVDGDKLVSYGTIVAKRLPSGMWIVAARTYSVTTRKHINFWLKTVKPEAWTHGEV